MPWHYAPACHGLDDLSRMHLSQGWFPGDIVDAFLRRHDGPAAPASTAPPGNYKTTIVMPLVSHQVELPSPTDVIVR